MKYIVTTIIKLYRILLSPVLPFNSCRFYPSCSQYALEAVEKHGPAKGLWLTVNRILNCHPLSRRQGYDPVP
ncbi:MAG: membrane protein insertion efficiency factor YidD [Ignavibacteriales bacterium]|nr:membrane protein insertion efficiency factor YidD [Ignavibacteriales bacterium]